MTTITCRQLVGSFYLPFSLRNIFSFILALFCIQLISSCSENDSPGGVLLPNSDRVVVRAAGVNKSIVSFTRAASDVPTDEPAVHLLGAVKDPAIGNTRWGFLSQFLLAEINPSLGSAPQCDSVVLFLPFAADRFGKYSSSDGKFPVRIFQLSSDISKESAYFQNTDYNSFFTLSDSVVSFTADPTYFYVSSDKPSNPGGLKCKLPPGFGQKLLDNPSNLTSNSVFLSAFKGLALLTDTAGVASGGGSVLVLDPLNSTIKSTITVYFHNDTQSGLKFDLQITADCARFNVADYNYSSVSEIQNQLLDTTSGTERIFLHSQFLQPVLFFPFLNSWRDSLPLTINRAQLVIPVKDFQNSSFSPPAQLVFFTYEANGSSNEISDFDEGLDYFLGSYNGATGEYRFNIGLYLQQILDGKRTDKGIWIRPIQEGNSPKRAVLSGSEEIYVDMIYSKF